jgi:hypothetical protein
MVLKNQPRLKLSDLLRRRKMTLKQMLDEHGITTFETLVLRCNRMGVTPPSEDDFYAVVKRPVNSPQEGVVVLEAPPFVEEQTGREIDPEAPVEQPTVTVLTDTPFEPPVRNALVELERPQKKPRKKKEDQPTEE